MSKLRIFLLSLAFVSANCFAIEPVMEQQGMFYFSMSFDAGSSTKTDHDFGFRFDRALMAPGENISMSQLVNKPAVFNLKLNNNGLKAFELNGVDYSYVDYVYHGAEGGSAAEAEPAAEAQPAPQTEQVQQPKRKLDVPLGVIIGVGIGAIAISSGF